MQPLKNFKSPYSILNITFQLSNHLNLFIWKVSGGHANVNLYKFSYIKCLPYSYCYSNIQYTLYIKLYISEMLRKIIETRKVENTLFYIKFMDLYYYNFRFILLGLADVFQGIYGRFYAEIISFSFDI